MTITLSASLICVDDLDLAPLGFQRHRAARTGRPGYHPAVLLKLFIYGYLNRIPSSRRLEREAERNVEVMWLTALTFLRLNGHGFRPDPVEGVRMMEDLASGKVSKAAFAEWLRRGIVPI